MMLVTYLTFVCCAVAGAGTFGCVVTGLFLTRQGSGHQQN